MWVIVILSHRLIVHSVPTKVIMRLSVFCNSIFLCLLSIRRHTHWIASKLVVRIRSSVIYCRCEAHRKVCNSHILNLANVWTFFFLELIRCKCLPSWRFLEEDWLWRGAETEVWIPWLFLQLRNLPLCLCNVLNINGSWSRSCHVKILCRRSRLKFYSYWK